MKARSDLFSLEVRMAFFLVVWLFFLVAAFLVGGGGFFPWDLAVFLAVVVVALFIGVDWFLFAAVSVLPSLLLM